MLSDPTERTDADGMERHLVYERGDERLAVVSLDQATARASPTDAFRFRIHVEHRSGGAADRPTTVERFRFDLRAPPTSVDPPAEIYLRAPTGGRWPDLAFEVVEDSWTRIAADETGDVGAGTLTLATVVDPSGLPADELGFGARVDLAEAGTAGTAYRLEARTRFQPVLRE